MKLIRSFFLGALVSLMCMFAVPAMAASATSPSSEYTLSVADVRFDIDYLKQLEELQDISNMNLAHDDHSLEPSARHLFEYVVAFTIRPAIVSTPAFKLLC